MVGATQEGAGLLLPVWAAGRRTRAHLLAMGFGTSSAVMFSFYKVKTKTTSGLGFAFLPTETREDFRLRNPPAHTPHPLPSQLAGL